jgi:hypothetical protein
VLGPTILVSSWLKGWQLYPSSSNPSANVLYFPRSMWAHNARIRCHRRCAMLPFLNGADRCSSEQIKGFRCRLHGAGTLSTGATPHPLPRGWLRLPWTVLGARADATAAGGKQANGNRSPSPLLGKVGPIPLIKMARFILTCVRSGTSPYVGQNKFVTLVIWI